MVIAHPGLMGALGGLAIGAAEFAIAMSVVRRVVAREVDEGGDLPGLGFVARRLRVVRNALAGFSFLALPALGFALGSTLGAQGGGVR